MLGQIKYLRRVRVETDALKRNKDLASTRTPLSLVWDEGVAGSKSCHSDRPIQLSAQQSLRRLRRIEGHVCPHPAREAAVR